MEAWLIVFFLLDEQGWTPGEYLSGWSPYKMKSIEACWERAIELNMQPAPDGALKWSWTCREEPIPGQDT